MVTLVPTWVSPGHGESDLHLDLTCNWLFSFPHGHHVDLVAVVFLVSNVPRDPDPHQGLTRTWGVWVPPAPHLDLVILVCI